MKRLFKFFLLAALLAIYLAGPVTPSAAVPSPRFPFPQHRAYAPDTIRPNHLSQTEQDDDVRTFYDYGKERYLKAAGTTPGGDPLYRIAFGSSAPDVNVTVSEGQGYGMIIVALMAGHDAQAQTYFDDLRRFARANPSGVDSRLMTWRVPIDGNGNTSAFNGDAAIAYALLLADKQWGSSGLINYKAEAELDLYRQDIL